MLDHDILRLTLNTPCPLTLKSGTSDTAFWILTLSAFATLTATGFRNVECHCSRQTVCMDDKLQIVGICDSGLTMLRASAILRLWNVDSGLFTPLAALCSRPAAGGLRSLGFMESGRLHCSGGHSESWNRGIWECAPNLVSNRALESWNLGICDS